MTYVRDQSSAELAMHIRSLQKMSGWHDPLADRLWKEVEELKSLAADRNNRIIELATELNAARDEIEALRKEVDRLEHKKLL